MSATLKLFHSLKYRSDFTDECIILCKIINFSVPVLEKASICNVHISLKLFSSSYILVSRVIVNSIHYNGRLVHVFNVNFSFVNYS